MKIFLIALTSLVFGCTSNTYDTFPEKKEETPMSGLGNDFGDGVPLNPDESKGAWQQSAELITGNSSQVGGMQASFADKPGMYTVQFGVYSPPSGGSFDCLATIVWKVEGATIQRQVSVGNGVSISGPGQAVDINFKDQTTVNPGQHYVIGTVVTKGTRASTDLPPTLKGGLNVGLAPLAQQVIDIPQNAGVISVRIFPYAASAVEANNPPFVIASLGIPAVGSLLNFDPSIDSDFVTIPPNATSLTLTNGSTTKTAGVGWIWGVDG